MRVGTDGRLRLGLALVLCAVFCLVVAGFQARDGYVLSRRGVQGVATVTQSHQEDRDHYVVVELGAGVAGDYRLPGDDRLGSQVAVRYDPGDPQVMVRASEQPGGVAVLMGAAGLVLGVMGTGSLRRWRLQRVAVDPRGLPRTSGRRESP